MAIRVYQYGLRPPTQQEPLIREALFKAHTYRNKLTEIERERRGAIRALLVTPEITEAEALLKAATRSTKKDLLRALGKARSAVFKTKAEDIESINMVSAEKRRTARGACGLYWGTYLVIETAADQARKAPLYLRDGLTPGEPRFQRYRGTGQVAVQVQNGLVVPAVLAGNDTRVRIVAGDAKRPGAPRYGELFVRVASEGRAPVFGVWPIKLHREIPSAASVRWVRVSCRRDGPWEKWTVEITVDDPSPRPRDLARANLSGAIAVEACWGEQSDGAMLVALTRDSDGLPGDLRITERIPGGLKKAAGIHAVRDMLLNDFKPKLVRMIHDLGEKKRAELPEIVRKEMATIELWKAPSRFHAFYHAWRQAIGAPIPSTPRAPTMGNKRPWNEPDNATSPFTLLESWYKRDDHLWKYETGARGGCLRRRKDFYRNFAARLARQYRTLILDDRDLSREARFGDDSELRFMASPYELRQALRQAFGAEDVIEHTYRTKDEDAPPWCERAIAAYENRASAPEGATAQPSPKGGAWARRKAKAETSAAVSATEP